MEHTIYQAERQALPVPWDGVGLGVGFGLALLLYLVLSVLAALLVDYLGWLGSPLIGPPLAVAQLAMAFPPLLIMSRHGNLVHLLGLNRFHWLMLVEMGAALFLGFMGSLLWALLLLAFSGEAPQEPLVPYFGEGIGAFVSVLVVAAILAPLTEEILFRGFLFGGLTRFTSPLRAALISGALFAAVHAQPLAFPALFVLGILLALLYYRTGSLWMPILMHFCINFVAILAQFEAARQGLL